MAATPQYGAVTLNIPGMGTRAMDIYVSDVSGALVNVDGGNGAGTSSPTEFTAPFPCQIIDFAIVTGTQDTTKLQVCRNGQGTGDMLRYSINLTTLAKRAPLIIPFNKGDKITFIQR